MIRYISKDKAVAILVVARLRVSEPDRVLKILSRIKWVQEEIPDGFVINEGLISLSVGDDLFEEIRAHHDIKPM